MNKKELKRIGKVIKWLIDALEPDKLDHKTWFVMGAAVQILNNELESMEQKIR